MDIWLSVDKNEYVEWEALREIENLPIWFQNKRIFFALALNR